LVTLIKILYTMIFFSILIYRIFCVCLFCSFLFYSAKAQQKSYPEKDNGYIASSGVHIWQALEIVENNNPDKLLKADDPIVEGVPTDSKIILNWFTAMDPSSSYYAVERSFDNNNFATIGLVLGGITSKEGSIVFKYKDMSASLKGKQVAYYKVKQISKEGVVVTYSKVLTVILRS
jgi:hypothetical protein